MERYDSPELVNVGWLGRDIMIRELTELVGRVVGFPGVMEWDSTKPDGTPRKLLDVSKLTALGWSATTTLEDGLRTTYQWWDPSTAACDFVRGKLARAVIIRFPAISIPVKS